MDDPLSRPPTAVLLEELRTRRRLSKQRLAELADVSATYVRNIEAGADEADRPVVPSANVIQKLARGLGRAEPDEARRADEERQAYLALMAAAGYLPAEPVDLVSASLAATDGASPRLAPPAPSAPTAQQSNGGLRLPPGEVNAGPLPREAAPPVGRSLTTVSPEIVALHDRRLARHLRDLLVNWDALASEDQALLLGIAELIAERRRRREAPA